MNQEQEHEIFSRLMGLVAFLATFSVVWLSWPNTIK